MCTKLLDFRIEEFRLEVLRECVLIERIGVNISVCYENLELCDTTDDPHYNYGRSGSASEYMFRKVETYSFTVPHGSYFLNIE